jgi:Xaa-Pro aminopeptidase
VVREGGAIYDVAVSSGAASGTLGPAGGAAGAAGWTTRQLRAGELLRIDAYGSVAGYLFDFARTIVVGGPGSDE